MPRREIARGKCRRNVEDPPRALIEPGRSRPSNVRDGLDGSQVTAAIANQLTGGRGLSVGWEWCLDGRTGCANPPHAPAR
jgi:hypothetical protein